MDRPRSAPRYPVLVDLAGAPCLVVGGGPVAARRVRGLREAAAVVTVVAPALVEDLSEQHSAGHLSWDLHLFEPHHLEAEPWRFVVAATNDPLVNAEVVAQATALGIWANDASASDGGPAALPAVHRDGPVTLTVSTGGIHPGAAAWLRDLAAGAIGPEHLVALDLLADERDLSPVGARPDWREAVRSGMLDLIREGRVAEAKERLQACLSSSSD